MRHRGVIIWALSGIILSSIWFGMQFRLPEVYRIPKCCDVAEYIALAELGSGGRSTAPAAVSGGVSPQKKNAPTPTPSVSSVPTPFKSPLTALFTHSGFHTLGYPIFLAAHRIVFGLIGITAIAQWVSAAAITTFLLYVIACVTFFFELRRRIQIHPVALFLTLINPAVVAHAILPLTDTLAIAFLLFFCSAFLRVDAQRRLSTALLAGTLLAIVIWLRTSLFPPAVLLLIVWFVRDAVRIRKKRWALIMPVLIACAAFIIVLSPRIIACTLASGRPCVVHIERQGAFVAETLMYSHSSFRQYTAVEPDGRAHFVFVHDPLLTARFAEHCPFSDAAPIMDLARCYLRNIDALPRVFFAKAVALFDHFHLNSYATIVTPLWVLVWMRVFAALAFIGCIALALEAFVRWRTTIVSPFLPLFLFLLSYVALSLPLTIDSRYGFPLLIAGANGLVWSAQRFRGTKWFLAVGFVAAALFLVQTFAWDALDPWNACTQAVLFCAAA